MAETVPVAKNRSLKVGVGLAAAAFAVVAASVVGLWMIVSRFASERHVPPPPIVQRADPAQAPAPVAAAKPAGPCDFDPLVPAQAPGDGRFDLDAALAGPTPPNAKAFMAVADEMAAQRRWRDAEVALIAACRAATPKVGSRGVPVANAQSRLGQFYVDYAQREPHGPRDEARARAQALLAASAATYEAVLGKQSSRTRMAAKRAAALAQRPDSVLGGGTAAAGAPPAGGTDEGTSAMGAARSQAMPRADVDLGTVDSDLARLQAQAGSVTRDPAGFRRRSAQAEAQRQACGGQEGCLRQWHAQRRRQLLNEF
jgi:hypothetical protein